MHCHYLFGGGNSYTSKLKPPCLLARGIECLVSPWNLPPSWWHDIYISSNLQCSFNSLILIEDISDHLPTVPLLKQTKRRDKTPIEYTSWKLNNDKIKNINNRLSQKDWNGILNSDDVNVNFDVLYPVLEETMDAEAPIQTVRISGKRRFQEPWLTTGIETASQKNHSLYKKTLRKDCNPDDMYKYKQHRNILNHLHCTTKTNYYNAKCKEYCTNIKTLWKLINQTIGKCKSGGSIIPFITVDSLKTYQPKKIANSFGEFYSNLSNWDQRIYTAASRECLET